jgi:hypothetical protein
MRVDLTGLWISFIITVSVLCKVNLLSANLANENCSNQSEQKSMN